MFKVGQLVTGKGDRYGITNHRSLCIVLCARENTMQVEVVAHEWNESYDGWVESKFFTPCTYAEFMEMYPNAKLTSHYTAEELSQIKNENMEEKKMELRMNKEAIGSYVLTEEERKTLRKEVMELLEEYDYNPTEYGVNKIIDEWVKNKGWMINLFKKHPNYNGKFQIVFSENYTRVTDKTGINNFGYWLEDVSDTVRVEKQIGAFSYREIIEIANKLYYMVGYMEDMQRRGYYPTANGKTLKEMKQERREWEDRKDVYYDAENKGIIKIYDEKSYDKKSWDNFSNLIKFAQIVRYCTENIATEEFADKVNKLFPEAKAVAGQKVSRIVNKVCTLTGVLKHREYNSKYASYSNSINPFVTKKHTVLSCHLVDYLTMSFGNSWSSCHTIDKHNRRNKPGGYSGAYSSGTESYMLDGSTFVFYTVKEDYNGNMFELQDKIERNMFHMGEDKLIQGRIYPQATDGENDTYKQFREIVQRVVAECLDTPNLWKNVKGSSECCSMINSYGTHYRDYGSFGDCNVSYLKGDDDSLNRKSIKVGHNPICPKCGDTHDYQEAVECYNCYHNEDEVCCECCGDWHDREDMHYIDGNWYCESCCFYCDYHEEWEIGDPDEHSIYVNDYGRVCDYAIECDSDFYTCDHCGEMYNRNHGHGEDYIETEDEHIYHNMRCAERAGYTCTDDGRWYPESEIHYCEHCGCSVHDDEWNEELECCTDCEEEVKAEKEELTETEREAV